MAGLSAGKSIFSKKFSFVPAAFLLVALLLTACGSDQPTATIAPATVAPTATIANTTVPPTKAPTKAPAPTATSDVARVFTTPAATPPPIFPTATVGPTVKEPNATATASVPDVNLTPDPNTNTATGQLAFVQAGNLWLIDNNGGSRLQLTNTGDIDTDSLVAWTPTFDRVIYQARTGELYTVDTTGQRDLVFAPGKTAQLTTAVGLPPLPTAPAGIPVTASNRAPVNSQVKPGKSITDLSWSPDGHFIAFTYFNGDNGPQTTGEVWVAEIISGKPALARVASGFSPSWGPDSHTLAFITRPNTKQGRPGQNNSGQSSPTPRGTSLLPPTVSFTTQAQGEAGVLQVGQGTPNPNDTTPGITPSASAGASASPAGPTSDPNATPTPFILRPGGNTTPSPNNSTPGATPTPTPTSNIVALPSPTPTPTYPPVFNGTYIANQLATYSTLDHQVKLLAESDKLAAAFPDLSGNLRSYVPAPFQAAWFSPDGRFVAFADQLSVVGVVPVAGGDPVIWTGFPQSFAAYQVQWLSRGDGAFVRWGNPYSNDLSRISLITFNNLTSSTGGIPGDVTNQKLVKITDLPGQKVICSTLSPDGQYFSYYDGTTMVITRSDGSIYQSYSDTECPVWSPFGSNFASIQKTGDRSIILNSLTQPAPKQIISTRAVERVFWLR